MNYNYIHTYAVDVVGKDQCYEKNASIKQLNAISYSRETNFTGSNVV